jgi:hypothetical protein
MTAWPLKSIQTTSGYLILTIESTFLKARSKSLLANSGKSTTKINSTGSCEFKFSKILNGKIAMSIDAKISPLKQPRIIFQVTECPFLIGFRKK